MRTYNRTQGRSELRALVDQVPPDEERLWEYRWDTWFSSLNQIARLVVLENDECGYGPDCRPLEF